MISSGRYLFLDIPASLPSDPSFQLGPDSGGQVIDEPTIGLDPALRAEFWDHFRDLAARGRTLLVSTHYLHEADRCLRVGLLRRGRLVAEGTPAGLRDQAAGRAGHDVPDMEDVFLVLTREEGGSR